MLSPKPWGIDWLAEILIGRIDDASLFVALATSFAYAILATELIRRFAFPGGFHRTFHHFIHAATAFPALVVKPVVPALRKPARYDFLNL